MKQLIKTTLTLSTILLLTACGQGDGEGKQNSEHGLLNTPPVAQAQTKALKEDSSVTITLKAIDEDNDTLGYKVTTAPKHGKLEGKAPNLSYVPHKDYNGKDSFSFIANDGLVDSNEVKIEIDIAPVADLKSLILTIDKNIINKDGNIVYVLTPTLDEGEIPDELAKALSNPKWVMDKPDIVSVNNDPNLIRPLKDGRVAILSKIADISSNSVDLIVDSVPPEITLRGNNSMEQYIEDIYSEPGATATDNIDQNITIQTKSDIDSSKEGIYKITYTATDSAGNMAIATRDVKVKNQIEIPSTLLDILSKHSIPYEYTTLKLELPAVESISLQNKSIDDKNITIAGYKQNDHKTFYFYNIPLLSKQNIITLKAKAINGAEVTKNLAIDANISQILPIALKAEELEGIQTLETSIEIYDDLNGTTYLLDTDADGIVDLESSDGKFDLSLNKEGRYKPRVTIQSKDGLYFSSQPYDLSLDVKASSDQKDPKGSEPIDVAKEFVEAIMNDDRQSVERLIGYSNNLTKLLYDHPQNLSVLKDVYSNITDYKQTYSPMGASVIIEFKKDGKVYQGGFEMMTAQQQLNKGRMWVIRVLY